MSTKQLYVTLSNGIKVPQVGLGTFLSAENEIGSAVEKALEAGYRHIDTAELYKNEAEIGDSIQKFIASGGAKREEIFVTTKLFANNNRPEDVEPSLRESLKKLKLDYIDLYLIHLPISFKKDGTHDTSVKLEEVWKAVEAVYEKGLAKAIGISNFNNAQIERVLRVAKIKPQNSQVEVHLNFNQQKHIEFAQKHNIVVTSYATLGAAGRAAFNPTADKPLAPTAPLQDPFVNELAKKYGKSPANILLRHQIQRGVIVIPKSTNPQRIRDNFNVFDFALTQAEVDQLNRTKQEPRLFSLEFMKGHPEDPFASER